MMVARSPRSRASWISAIFESVLERVAGLAFHLDVIGYAPDMRM
jgi:hypothetical protein